MDFSIVTPSFDMLPYLKRCCASVADQRGPAFEHIVVDGLSTDGTTDWLRDQPHITSIIERDSGMYDAINKGLRIAQGQIVAYLNCDEQYLPTTLAYVKQYFDRHPEVDILFGGTLLVRPDGTLLSVRKPYKPSWPLILSSHLYLYSASMFVRRRLFEAGEYFDAEFRCWGDFEFVPRVLRKGYHAHTVEKSLAVFTMTGNNRGLVENNDINRDRVRIGPRIPWWIHRFKFPLRLVRMAIKLSSGAYFPVRTVDYAIYASDETLARQQFRVRCASAMWRTA
jgi:glycosyltransferase involved in cell wall biosynthesis